MLLARLGDVADGYGIQRQRVRRRRGHGDLEAVSVAGIRRVPPGDHEMVRARQRRGELIIIAGFRVGCVDSLEIRIVSVDEGTKRMFVADPLDVDPLTGGRADAVEVGGQTRGDGACLRCAVRECGRRRPVAKREGVVARRPRVGEDRDRVCPGPGQDEIAVIRGDVERTQNRRPERVNDADPHVRVGLQSIQEQGLPGGAGKRVLVCRAGNGKVARGRCVQHQRRGRRVRHKDFESVVDGRIHHVRARDPEEVRPGLSRRETVAVAHVHRGADLIRIIRPVNVPVGTRGRADRLRRVKDLLARGGVETVEMTGESVRKRSGGGAVKRERLSGGIVDFELVSRGGGRVVVDNELVKAVFRQRGRRNVAVDVEVVSKRVVRVEEFGIDTRKKALLAHVTDPLAHRAREGVNRGRVGGHRAARDRVQVQGRATGGNPDHVERIRLNRARRVAVVQLVSTRVGENERVDIVVGI